MGEFKLDTSGCVCVPAPEHFISWDQLSPFVQGYVEALLRERIRYAPPHDHIIPDAKGFSDLAPETLARIIEDCERWQRLYPKGRQDAPSGSCMWIYRTEQWVKRPDFPPLTATLGDDGKIYLSNASQSEGVQL